MALRKLLAILMFIASLHASRLDISVQSALKWNKKITGGEEAPRDEFLYKCAIYIQKTTENELNFCSGSIISERFVLSAAHCFASMESGVLIAGVHDLQEENAPYDWDFERTDVILHWNYDAAANLNDIALINATNSPFTFAIDLIQKIKIATQTISVDNLVGMIGRIAGWGQTTDDNLEISNILLYIDAEIIDSKTCRSIYGNKVTANNICLSGENGQSTCQGDSGGGLQVFFNNEKILVGVVSFGAEAGCEKNYPTVFTFIPPYYNWINSIIN